MIHDQTMQVDTLRSIAGLTSNLQQSLNYIDLLSFRDIGEGTTLWLHIHIVTSPTTASGTPGLIFGTIMGNSTDFTVDTRVVSEDDGPGFLGWGASDSGSLGAMWANRHIFCPVGRVMPMNAGAPLAGVRGRRYMAACYRNTLLGTFTGGTLTTNYVLNPGSDFPNVAGGAAVQGTFFQPMTYYGAGYTVR